MKIGKFDLNERVLIVAEIGNNHEGHLIHAQDLIVEAAEAGVDAVKFQTYKTELFVRPSDRARFDRLKAFEFGEGDFEMLKETAVNNGVMFLSTPLDLESARFLNSLAPAFKIASGDNNFYPLLETVARTGKPIILSGGLSDIEQLATSKALIEDRWREQGIEQEVAVLHCVTSYPTPDNEANLGAISQLKRALGCTVGYSDHTLGIEAAVLSVALGARIIEKHFTLDKEYSDFRDHQLSADPDEMAQLVQRVRHAQEMIGSGEKVLQRCERDFAVTARRSIVARRDLEEGVVIIWDDITWMRPADGLPPGMETRIVGRTLLRPVRTGEAITLDMVRD